MPVARQRLIANASLRVREGLLDTGGDEPEPSLTEVYAAAELAQTAAAPAPLGGEPPVLDAKVDNLEFPDWRKGFGWEAVGRRDDTLSGRPVTTVFYRNPEGARLGYAVVSGDALGGNPPGRQVTRKGKTYDVARVGERTIVTWTQEGHTCVITTTSAVPQGATGRPGRVAERLARVEGPVRTRRRALG